MLLAVLPAWARDKQANWVETTTQHFTVICDGKEKDARRIAGQFERMRLVFHTAFPNMQMDPGTPIIIIAVHDAKIFRTLEPEIYLKKGQLDLAGLFQRAPGKNYVLLRMGADGEHPYATVYHEYTHLLLSKTDFIPLWLNEGLAQFYQNSDISEKGTLLGEPDADQLEWLRQNRLLPLSTLFAVDENSPYYHEESKGSIFYAESWALTHYLLVKDYQNKTRKLGEYLGLVANQGDAVTAAMRAFGDLKQLQSALESYIEHGGLGSFRLARALPVDDTTFQVRPLPPEQADAVRADFLAYTQRESDSRVLLQQVLQADPNNTLAHETMGYLEFRAGHLEQAQRWFQQAVQLGSQNFLAHYYFAASAMNRGSSEAGLNSQIEASLQKAVALNPLFAPAYDRLAVFYGMRRKNLDQAHMLTLKAVQLDPGNVAFRLNAARVLLVMGEGANAAMVLQTALKVAKSSSDVAALQAELGNIRQMQAARQQNEQPARLATAASRLAPASPAVPEGQQPSVGPTVTLTGTIRNVRCAIPAVMDLDLLAGGKTITLHTGNFSKVQFGA
ncbi:MAG TPA: tetratricopeptide repeat protein, partial [Terriglobales bacterium]|nr:tetratricopeptide repeat protein [Terriglobales bacterium]